MAESELDRLNKNLELYASVSKKAAAEVLRDKAYQLVLGNKESKHGAAFKGLYDRFTDIKPARGSIRSTLETRLKSGGGIIVHGRAREQAEKYLQGAKSGLFQRGGKGLVSVMLGKRGQRLSPKTKKGKIAVGNARQLYPMKRDGDAILNRQSLSVALEIKNREAGIGYSAAALLRRHYQKILGKKAKPVEYKPIDTKKGIPPVIKINNERKKILIRNRSTTSLGEGTLITNDKENTFNLSLYTTTMEKAGARKLVNLVLKDINSDISAYLKKKGLVAK